MWGRSWLGPVAGPRCWRMKIRGEGRPLLGTTILERKIYLGSPGLPLLGIFSQWFPSLQTSGPKFVPKSHQGGPYTRTCIPIFPILTMISSMVAGISHHPSNHFINVIFYISYVITYMYFLSFSYFSLKKKSSLLHILSYSYHPIAIRMFKYHSLSLCVCVFFFIATQCMYS